MGFWEAKVIIVGGVQGENTRKLPSSSACWDFCLFYLFRKSKNHLAGPERMPPSFSRAAVGRTCWKLGHGSSKAYLILLPRTDPENGMEPPNK